MVTTIVHAGHKHAVVVVKEVCAQVHQLRVMSVSCYIVNNECSVYGITIVNRTLLDFIRMQKISSATHNEENA